ncbi:MAG: hypothetical protein ACXWC2_23095 [Ramlibacter sp.]
MDVMPILPETELEATAAQYLGRLLFVFGRLELNLGLALVNLHPASASEREAARVEELRFGDKLKELEAKVLASHAANARALARWRKWFLAADTLRELRNAFAHGRWGFQHYHQQIVHVSHVPGGGDRKEVRYTLEEFAAHVAAAEELAEEFSTLRDMHPVSRTA